ncbi:MAG: ABC transporter ATP-binding protein [Desulfobacterales bacterium]|jgi:peptide/nickel transport system ATP-binding protein
MLASIANLMKPDHAIQPSLLVVENLVVEFGIGKGSKIHAVSDITFSIGSGETLGLVGESGCGKSTVARSIVQLQKPTSGKIWFDGHEMTDGRNNRLRELRPRLQMIFQDAAASLNPARRVGRTISEPLRATGGANRRTRCRKARTLLQQVGLDPDQIYDRRPFEISIGQCQRISIARALISNPKLLICDEPVSSLDVSVQAQILNLLERMKAHHNLTMLFISHDLTVVKNICDRVAVMYLGKLCEIADSESLYQTPRHPYTAALQASIPEISASRDHMKIELRGVEIPSPAAPPSGCRFRTRCPRAQQRCVDKAPVLEELDPGSRVACHYPLGKKRRSE